MPLTVDGQNTSADAVAGAYSWLALFDGDPEAAGTEITGGGYARQQVTFDAASAGTPGQAEGNNLPLTFPILGGQTVSHWALYSLVTAGTRGASGAFAASEAYVGDGSFDVNTVVLDPLAS